MNAPARVFRMALAAALLPAACGLARVDTILVATVVQPCAELTFDYSTAEQLKHLGGLNRLGLVPGLIGSGVKKGLVSDDSRAFSATIGQFDRKAVYDSVLAAELVRFSPCFRVVVLQAGAAQALLDERRPDMDAARKTGCQCLLRVRETRAGMVTQVPDKVQACSGVSFDFYDCASGKRLLDGEAARFAAHTRDKEPALTQRATFVGDYQFAVRAVATALIGQLNQKDILHTVAAQYGLGDKVPAIGTLLKQYERRFSYSLESPRGWTDLKYTSKYNAGVFPKKDGNVVSVVLSVDLLLDAFGNNVSTVEEYQCVWLERVAAAGFAVETTAPFTGLTLPAGWLGFSIATKDRQGRLVELMHVSNAVVFDLELVFVKQYDEYFAKYREDMQSIVANSAFEASAD